LISFKKSNRALDSFTGGELKGVTTNNDKVLVYKRQKGSNVVLTLINLRKTTQSVTITLNKPGKYLRFTDGAKVNLKSKFKITLKGAGFQLFARD
jgi:hypothetical protein